MNKKLTTALMIMFLSVAILLSGCSSNFTGKAHIRNLLSSSIIIMSPRNDAKLYNNQVAASGTVGDPETGSGSPSEVIVKAESLEYYNNRNSTEYTNTVKAQVTYSGGTYKFQAMVPLIVGPNKITAIATYNQKNTSSAPINVMYITAPIIKIISPIDNNSIIAPSPFDFDTIGFAQIKTTKPGETILPVVKINGLNSSVSELESLLARRPGDPSYGANANVPLKAGQKNLIQAIVTDQYGQNASVAYSVWLLTLHLNNNSLGTWVLKDATYPGTYILNVNRSHFNLTGRGSGRADGVYITVISLRNPNQRVKPTSDSPDSYRFEADVFLAPGINNITAQAMGTYAPPLLYDSILVKYSPVPINCIDGTKSGTCSSAKPKYCEGGILVDECKYCRCPPNYSCQQNRSCKLNT